MTQTSTTWPPDTRQSFRIDQYYCDRADRVAIKLRRQGYSAYVEIDGADVSLVTDASRLTVLIAAGHGQFIVLPATYR